MTIPSKQRVVVYTSITNGYDELTAPALRDPLVEYICFSDGKSPAITPWRMIDVRHLEMTAKDRNRYVKMHPHLFLPDHDLSVYVDGSIKIIGDLRSLLASIEGQKESTFLYDHPQRNCIYEEGAACAFFGHDWGWRIRRQMRGYRDRSYPLNNGLFEAGVLIRRNVPEMRSLMGAWWIEYATGVKRDQLSLPYVSWREGVPLGSLGRSDPRFVHDYFRFVNHRQRTSLVTYLKQRINRVYLRGCWDGEPFEGSGTSYRGRGR